MTGHRSQQWYAGADVSGREELFVQLAAHIGLGFLQTACALEMDTRRVLAVDQDALWRPRQLGMSANRSVEVQLLVRIWKRLDEVELASSPSAE